MNLISVVVNIRPFQGLDTGSIPVSGSRMAYGCLSEWLRSKTQVLVDSNPRRFDPCSNHSLIVGYFSW